MAQKNLEKQVHLPFSRAFKIAMDNIRVRFGRSMVTASGIFLGIAFLSNVWMQGSINEAMSAVVSPDQKMRHQWLVTLALLMSTIGITNSMLMSVTERFKEIGTMKCLGALDRFVVTMFILEGMLMGVLASLAGVIVGGGIMLLMAGFTQGWQTLGNVGLAEILRVTGICVVLGSFLTLLATIAPAYKAAKMPPAAALRAEI